MAQSGQWHMPSPSRAPSSVWRESWRENQGATRGEARRERRGERLAERDSLRENGGERDKPLVLMVSGTLKGPQGGWILPKP